MPDDALLETAIETKSSVVTRNVADFARLHQLWHHDGRRHYGIVMITQQAFPQDRSFVGAVTASLVSNESLLQRARDGEVVYLRPIRT
jgi:hypothetical protein